MTPKTEIEIQKAALKKAYISQVRLKHSLHADREIALNYPEIEQRIDEALQGGQAFELSLDKALADED